MQGAIQHSRKHTAERLVVGLESFMRANHTAAERLTAKKDWTEAQYHEGVGRGFQQSARLIRQYLVEGKK